MKSLHEIWLELAKQGYETDKGSVHDYLYVYEQILAPYRETAKNIIEIGLFNGHSMRLWSEYFTIADVHGIDCDAQPHGGMADLRPMIATGWLIHIMDATDAGKVAEKFGNIKFDFICEDAGHSTQQQLELYSVFKNYLSPDGIYVIEDIQDIDTDRELFENIDPEKTVTIIDRRHTKGRYDDILVTIKAK